MRVINSIAPELAADIRAAISGKPRLKPAKAAKAPKQPKCMVPQLHRVWRATGVHIVQLPIFLEQPKKIGIHNITAKQLKWRVAREQEEYAELRDSVATIIQGYYPNGLDGLRAIDYVRLSPRAGNPKTEMDDDNLGFCFKAIRDSLCRYARDGAAWREHLNTIGQADGWLKQQGVKWVYRQAKYEPFPKIFGIQIWLRFDPRTTE
jgi:hypothetical protein